jgi:hypothetical protein
MCIALGGLMMVTGTKACAEVEPLRIMCLGDSITAGYTDNPNWSAQHLFQCGYRSGLYILLKTAGYKFLFVGGSPEPWDLRYGDPTRGGTHKPELDLRDLGQDGHRGYGGWKASDLQPHIVGWLNSDDPDLVLLKIGTNEQNTNTLHTIVGTIFETKPDVRLIIAQIMPKISYQEGVVEYNRYICDVLVPSYRAQGRRITVVDQYAPFLRDPEDLASIDRSLFSNGINHPSNAGYAKMAQVWFDEIRRLGVARSND